MSEENQIIEVEPQSGVMLGAIPTKPDEVVKRASAIATVLANIVNERKLFKVISGRKYVQVEGWNTLGAMLGVLPVENRVLKTENGYEAYVDLIRTSDGMKIGGSSAICTFEERNWQNRDEFAVRSMAITRATGKAFRLGFSWIMQLAGYEATPAEEMPHDVEHPVTQSPASSRPYSPEVLKARLFAIAANHKKKGTPCTENTRKVTAAALGKLFADNTDRYEFCQWATGKASTKDIPSDYILALQDWMGVHSFEVGPDSNAKSEAQSALAAARVASGQMEMNIEGGE